MSTGGVSGDITFQDPPVSERETDEKNKKLEELFMEANVLLGGDSIQLDLTDNDYQVCFDRAVREYRALSGNSIYETYGFLQTETHVQEYKLPKEVDLVSKIYRRRALFAGNGNFDYFAQVMVGQFGFPAQSGGYLGLATYDFTLQYERELERLFAREIRFTFRSETNTLFFLQVPNTIELMVLRLSILKTIDQLLTNHWSYNWLQQYLIALLKSVLANKWGKFGQLPGAQGGVALNWQKFQQEAIEEMKALKQAIRWGEDGGIPAAFPMMG